MLKCVECGKPTWNLTQIYCECGGLVEVIPQKKKPVANPKTKKK
ncbi:hypothetical protein [Pseudobacteroides cellulosolvens]|uniref:Uncharacterized protein n=1 Tax=Pseudobacteroides cellulosolvens ATCC 35603 = DSM 2933 TaxID=398512 RepID=A0A0L6JH72_9FIRM|nr:hypothetical protein [Pseudobacteroides cellulosolvens]KNY24817.1 hypothetical protein Bccel_0074 [Pseudobacteroides cellulosolvens ATCC 35603 = DSM 2933]